MKKLILMMLAAFAISINVQAQETQDQQESPSEIPELMADTDFMFTPSEVSSMTGDPILINKNEYMRVRPGGELNIRMTKPEGMLGMESNKLIVKTKMAQINENALNGDSWVMVITVDADDMLMITITADINTGFATVMVESDKQDTFTYKGKIVAPHIDDSTQSN